MAKKNPLSTFPEKLRDLVRDVVSAPVSPSDVDSYGKLRQIQDRSHRLRTIVKAWKDQQTQDRKMRARYASYLIMAMGVQTLVVNIIFILMGCGVLTFEPGTAKTFFLSVFAEIASMVLLVVKYLFTPSSDRVLQLLRDTKRTSRSGR